MLAPLALTALQPDAAFLTKSCCVKNGLLPKAGWQQLLTLSNEPQPCVGKTQLGLSPKPTDGLPLRNPD